MQPEPIKLCECGCGEPAPIARQTDRKRGYVAGGPRRFILGHRSRLMVRPLAERFWEKTEPATDLSPNGMAGCILWTGAVMGMGRGSMNDGEGGTQLAHRVAWKLEYGAMPVLELDHLCRRPLCVNVAHLEPVTHAENMRRGANAKLTAADVAEIRRRRETGERVATIAEAFELTKTHVYYIVNRKAWA